MPKPTWKDIAQAAGVSAMTVSKALNGKPGVSEDRRREICEVAGRMNYAPNLITKSLRVDETKTIGVTNHGCSIILANTDHQPERELQAIRMLLSKQIDGLILVAPTLCADAYSAKRPTVRGRWQFSDTP